MKAQLNNAFRSADICQNVTKGKSRFKRYPAILDVREKPDRIEYVFKIPNGLNPDELENKKFVFKQIFGAKHELTGDGSKYLLRVYLADTKKSYKYDYDEIKQSLNGTIPIIAGKDMMGKFYCFDMINNPHLLIAGETGSGKSVMLRSIITTLILSNAFVDLYLADMKRSEFHVFRNREKVKAVMTDKTQLSKCLLWIQKEMVKRGNLLDEYEVEHIKEYNKLKGVEKKRYIVLCIDEVALLKKEKDLMDIIEEISCIGRALGIFLILSMQRPDSKVMEGQLKNNLTVRYAFRHSDKINSNISLGQGSQFDASTIQSNESGRFFFKNEKTVLLQSPLLELKDARKLLEPYKRPDGEVIDVFGEEVSEDIAQLPDFMEGDSND